MEQSTNHRHLPFIILSIFESLIRYLLGTLLLLLACYAVFCIWDDKQIYLKAQNMQESLQTLRPEADDGRGNAFDELLDINPDVTSWLILENTGVDSPVLQGATNLIYLNHNVYGESSVSGALFLDSRCSREYTDVFSLIYGHQMRDGSMFGDLERYEREEFFEQNYSGKLITPKGESELEIFACMHVGANEENIFEPDKWQEEDIEQIVSFVKDHALHYRECEHENKKILAMSTCSQAFTNARCVVLAWY